MNTIKKSVHTWFVNQMESTTSLNDGMEGLSNLSQLTVVVPSYERQEFLLRQIVYWKGTEVNLVIVDGSERPLETVLCHYLEKENFTYFHSHDSFFNRLKLAVTKISTKYTVLLGDDEFFLKTGLVSVLDQLDGNPNIEACIGQTRKFNILNDNITYQDVGYPSVNYHIQQTDVAARLNAAMRDYKAATCYAVIRSETWAKSYGNMTNWGSPYTAEMQQAFYVHIAGKLTTSDKLYWLRSSENSPINIKSFDRNFSFESWWGAAKFNSEKEVFVKLLAAEIRGKQNDQDSRAIVVDAVKLFIESSQKKRAPKNLYEKFMRRSISFCGGMARLFLPHWLFSKLLESLISLRAVIATVLSTGCNSEKVATASDLPTLTVAQHQELIKIENFIRQFTQVKNAI
jgi:glycosyltransferase domain-containing protein